jgi:hypothetical protein
MNRDDQMAGNSSESNSAPAIESNSIPSREVGTAALDGQRKRRRRDYDGAEALDDPAHEAIAVFFATSRQFRQFKSVSALAEQFGVSRITIYRRAADVDVVQRIKWLLERSMLSGDLIACREWAAIVKAQVEAALAGDTRAAMFCQSRAWRQNSTFDSNATEPAIAGVDTIATWLEAPNEFSTAEELDQAKENPEMDEGNNPHE